MIVSIIAVALAGVVFAAVGYPLLRSRREPAIRRTGAHQLALEDLLVQRDETYAAIKELDFDHEMGNLAEVDYQQLRERYRRKAAGMLQELDMMQVAPAAPAANPGPDTARELASSNEDEIEREVHRRRVRRRPPVEAASSCQSCGGPLAPQDRFCAACGTAVGQRCPGCGSPCQPEDHFCGSCGAPLLAEMAR